MTFLPIIDRELRVAARKRSTFWLRVASALVGMVIGGGIMMLSRAGAFGPSTMGNALFAVLTWLALLVALTAGLFFTADCLSEEKRDGTLGFLFLTDLRGYDVAGGKLLATSLRVTYALMSVIPILAVAFLMGAVSGPQYWKTALALLNALFCSLSAGLMVSALSRDAQKALGATVLLLLLLVLGGPAADGIYANTAGRVFRPVLSLASPGYVFTEAGAWGRSPYWRALGVSHAVGWGLLALACLSVPHSWQERVRRPRASRRSYWWRYGGARRLALRRKLLDGNPILWLCSRERWQSIVMWGLSLILAGGLAALVMGKIHHQNNPMWIGAWGSVAWLSGVLVYLWMASQAGRFYLEARRSGLLEALLATPLSVKEVVQGPWRALVRMFGPPVALLLVVQLVGGSLAYQTAWGPVPHPWSNLAALATSAVSTLSTLASLAAVAWFGLWMGMTSRNASLITLKTIVLVKVVPFLVISFVTMFAIAFLPLLQQTMGMGAANFRQVTTTITNASGTTTAVTAAVPFTSMTPLYMSLLMTCLPAVLNVGVDLGFIALARSRLHSTFRQRAAGVFGSIRRK